MALMMLSSWRWMLANLAVAMYLVHSYHRIHSRSVAIERDAARRLNTWEQAPDDMEDIDAGSDLSDVGVSLIASPLSIPGTAGTDYAACDASSAPHVDVRMATQLLKDSCTTRYHNTTLCEDLGPSCIIGDDLVLYHPERQPQPTDGWYRRLVPDVFKRLNQVMFWVSWGGSNADGYNGNLLRLENHRGFTKAWPAGKDATPPVPFSTCNTPLLLYWDFPENFYHTLASFASLWSAVRGGAISANVSVAVGLPLPYLASGKHGRMAEYITAPLAAMFSGPIAPLWHFSGHGQEDDGAGVTTARAYEVGEPQLIDPRVERASGAAPTPAISAARAAQHAAQRAWNGRLGLPGVRCFARTPVCSVAGYSERPPLHFYEFMQAVKDELLGLPRNYDAASPAIRPYAWPSGKRFVTGTDGVLRVTLAVRSEGTRRVLNTAELLSDCQAAGKLAVASAGGKDGKGEDVRMSCDLWEFGAQGMAADAAKMQATDVLVAVHGAGLTNLGYLRPGSVVVELRPGSFRASNADRFYRPMAHASRALKFWCVRLQGGFMKEGAAETKKGGNSEKWERDKDLLVPWEGLARVMSSVLGMGWDQWDAVAKDTTPEKGPFTDITS